MSVRVRNLILVSTAVVVGLLWRSTPAEAQTYQPHHEGIGIGVKAGPLFSSLDSNITTDEFSQRTGFIGGLFLGGNRPGIFGAAVEFLYARKAFNDKDPNLNQSFDYFEIPVLLRINAGSPNLSGVNVYGVVGPTFDLRLRSKFDTGQSLNDQTAGADVGIAVGAGVEITRFIVEGRYTRGLRNIYSPGSTFPTLGEKITSHTFAVFLGVRFN